MARVDQRAALDRLGKKLSEMEGKDHAGYMFLVLGILGSYAPDVLQFLMDRADEKLAAK